ncbi:unnamed protein product [Tuwongella immobilis]|uniref:Uncharacterized protein n=1 Tax=Tuwongella immobilis TaxID=692036 RepID=A0A6C2YIX3_9BACT|nr:unnamed protein product [Tuwongella immobilis]VTR97282.1 unnamed protein product [Tuwongella immobilis]
MIVMVILEEERNKDNKMHVQMVKIQTANFLTFGYFGEAIFSSTFLI